MPYPSFSPGRAGGTRPFFWLRRAALVSWLFSNGLNGFGQQAAPPAPTPQAVGQGRTTVDFAKGFTLRYAANYKVLTILGSAGQPPARYLLVPRGAGRPAGFAGVPVIATPVRTLVGLSSTHVALADFLGAADVLVGLGSLQYASAPRVRQRIAAGKIIAVGEGKELNNELLIAQHPDLVMATGWPGEGPGGYQTLAAAGIPVLLNSEWVETTPLGRAEWVKVLAALLNKEDLVNQKFGRVARSYQRLAALGHRAAQQPRVVLGLPFKDVWYVPAAGNYLTQLLRDAGTTYAWDRTNSAQGSLALAFEAVAPVALTADYWLQTGTATSRAEIAAQDARYATFAPFQHNRVYNNNRRTNAQGSNDYWESGAVRPDLVLSDLIRILHPELLPGWQLYYYQQLQ